MRYDVIVVGSGISGLAAAALLAKEHCKKVLVLERAPFIGGRAASFVGKGNKVTIDGLELDASGLKKALGIASTYLFSSEPSIEEVFAQGLLDGYTFEAGGHGLFWGNNSRLEHLLHHLGEHVEIPCNKGLGYVDWEAGNKAYQVEKARPYAWMSEAEFGSCMSALRAMGQMSITDAAAHMNEPLGEWLNQYNLPQKAYDYIKILSASQTAQAEPAMTPAGDFLYYMAMAKDIRMNLVSGSCGTADAPGTMSIPLAFAKVLQDNGGEIRRSTSVEQIIVENGVAKGVVIKTATGTETIHADVVLANVMPKQLFNVLDRRLFPADWVQTIEQKYWGAGLLTAFMGLKRDIWKEKGIDERSFIYMPGVIRGEGFIGDVDIVVWAMGACANRTPAGKRSFEFSVSLTDVEMRNPERVGKVTSWCENWFKQTFPGEWENNVEFCVWTPSPEAYGQWRPVGTERIDNKSEHVQNLYFVGDQYGKRLFGGGVDGASLSAIMTVDTIMGTDLETQILPAYHRGMAKA